MKPLLEGKCSLFPGFTFACWLISKSWQTSQHLQNKLSPTKATKEVFEPSDSLRGETQTLRSAIVQSAPTATATQVIKRETTKAYKFINIVYSAHKLWVMAEKSSVVFKAAR